jgi:hypothetical protein
MSSRSFFSDPTLASGKNSGITKLRFEKVYLPHCTVFKTTLISRNAVNRTVTHPPIPMGIWSK